MPVTHRTVLIALVDAFDETADPQPPTTLGERLDAPSASVRETLESLAEYELVVSTGTGYRPTVTGYELLELDAFDDGDVIIDVPDE